MARFLALFFACIYLAVGKFVRDETFPDLKSIPAAVLKNWTQVRCVAFDSHRQELHTLHLGQPPVLTFSLNGTYLRGWGGDVVVYPHGCEMRGTELWVADSINDPHTMRYGDFTVRRIDPERGTLLSKIGTSGVEGSGINPIEYGEVTDVSFTPEGDVFITDGGDGDGMNERLVRLDGRSFKPMWVRGNNGTVSTTDDPVGNFSQLHSVTYDPVRDLVWVADRAHNRVVAISGADGSFVGHWPCIVELTGNGPNSVRFDHKRNYVVTTLGNGGPTGKHTDSVLFALKGDAQSDKCSFAVPSIDLNTTDNAHEIDVDVETGDVYIAMEANLGMPVRFRLEAFESATYV